MHTSLGLSGSRVVVFSSSTINDLIMLKILDHCDVFDSIISTGCTIIITGLDTVANRMILSYFINLIDKAYENGNKMMLF